MKTLTNKHCLSHGNNLKTAQHVGENLGQINQKFS